MKLFVLDKHAHGGGGGNTSLSCLLGGRTGSCIVERLIETARTECRHSDDQKKYLQFQLQDLLLQFAHFGFFSVPGGLGCHSVFQFPVRWGQEEKRRRRGGGGGINEGRLSEGILSAMLRNHLNRPCSCHAGTSSSCRAGPTPAR